MVVRAFNEYAKVCYWAGSHHSFLDECRKMYGVVSACFVQ